MTNVQLTLIFSKYLVQSRFSFSIISQKRPFSHTVLQFDKKNGVENTRVYWPSEGGVFKIWLPSLGVLITNRYIFLFMMIRTVVQYSHRPV